MDIEQTLLWVLVALLALSTWFLLGSLRRMRTELEDGMSDARRMARNNAEELESTLAVQRELLARIAEGQPVEREMVLEGRLWRDLSNNSALELLERGEAYVLDVRTPQETAAGVIPGAALIPIDELESRLAEVPRKGAKLVYCAAGARSAAACELLSRRGFDGLHNLEGGYGSWNGPRGSEGLA